MRAAHGLDSWSVLMAQQGHFIETSTVLMKQITSTVTISIPFITGDPFCINFNYSWLSFLGFAPSHTPAYQCQLISNGWATAYLLLFLASVALTVIAFSIKLYHFRFHTRLLEERLVIKRYTIQLLLMASTLFTLTIYIHSQAPITFPETNSRYLIGLWIATPALLWPLWLAANMVRQSVSSQWQLMLCIIRGVCKGLIIIIFAFFLLGTCLTLTQVPPTLANDQQQHFLVDNLLKAGITHIYSDYQTCNRIIFLSEERIICGVVDQKLLPEYNRYMPYYTTVSKDAHSSYCFPMKEHNDAVIEKKLQQEGINYRRFTLADYTVYQLI